MTTILDRYIFRLVATRFVQFGGALFAVMMLERALRLVQEMTVRGMHVRHFPVLLAELAPYYLNLALPAAFAAALVASSISLANHREVEVMASFGLPLRRIVRPMIGFGLIAAAASLILGGWLEPLGRYNFRIERALARNGGMIEAYQAPAVVQPDPALVLTADRQDTQGLEGVFVWFRDPSAGETVITGRKGLLRTDPDGARLEVRLQNGQMWMGAETGMLANLLHFDSLTLHQPLTGSTASWQRGRDADELTLGELLAQPAAAAHPLSESERRASALARFARSLTIPLLPLLVLPLVLGAPRGQRGTNIIATVAVLMLFHHGINLAKNVGGDSPAGPEAVTLAVVAPFVALVAVVWMIGRALPGPARLQLGGSPRLLRKVVRLVQRAVPLRTQWVFGGLSGYLLGQVLSSVLIALAGFVALMLLVDLIEHGEDLLRIGAGFSGTLRYMAYRLPVLAVQLLPPAMLAGSLFALVALRENREMLAIQLNGISAFGILRRTAPVALGLGLLGLMLSEIMVPASQTAFARWWEQLEQAQLPVPDRQTDERQWFRIDNEVVSVTAISPDGRELSFPTVYQRSRDGDLVGILAAETAIHGDSGWLLREVEVSRFADGLKQVDDERSIHWNSRLAPSGAKRFAAEFAAISAREARAAMAGGISTTHGLPFYRVRTLQMLLQPLTPLVMLVLAIAASLAPPRDPRLAWKLYFAALAGLLFLIVDGCLAIAGSFGLLYPWQAVVAGPALFLLLGFSWLLRSEMNG